MSPKSSVKLPARKTLLVTGASGLLMNTMLPDLAKVFEIHALYHQTPSDGKGVHWHRCNLAADALEPLFVQVEPDIVINAAAISTDRECSSHPDRATEINTHLPRSIAQLCSQYRCKMIHLSTDQVYQGTRRDYLETDTAQPVNTYGRTKLAGEHEIESTNSDAVILRLALMHGLARAQSTPRKKPFSHTLIDQLVSGQPVRLFTDEYRTALYIDDLTGLLLTIMTSDRKPLVGGVYNAGGYERHSRHAYALQLCEVFGLPESLLLPVSAGSMEFAEPRPADCSMNSDKLQSASGWKPTQLATALKEMKQRYTDSNSVKI